jgi:lipoprotein-releasing system ATP-binding protein
MGDPVLGLTGVVKEYGERVVTRVLHGIDLTLGPGEFAALIGPSGSGKSTLLNLMGLLDRPTAGAVRVLGQATSGLDDRQLTFLRGRALGFIFQFHHLLPAFTARENVLLPILGRGPRPDAAAVAAAEALLAQVGLADRMGARASELSGGQQQRVAVARALVHRPALVLADEPTGNLDTQSADGVFALLRQFNRADGIAFLVVTHDPRLAARCDRTIELVDGRIVADRPSAIAARTPPGAMTSGSQPPQGGSAPTG